VEDILQKSLSEVAATLLTLLTTVLIPYGLVLLRSWVKSKTALIEDRNLREGLEFAFDRLDHTAETVVREIDQLVKQRVDGKVKNPQGLKNAALGRVYKRLPATAMQVLQQNYTEQQINAIIGGKIEQKVKGCG
jgi:hypothetical protein